jgi:hypothetical protein
MAATAVVAQALETVRSETSMPSIGYRCLAINHWINGRRSDSGERQATL